MRRLDHWHDRDQVTSGDLPSVRPFFTTWRVSYWRQRWTEPRRTEFGRLADAERFARQALIYVDSKSGGAIVRVEIEERLTTSWSVIHRSDRRRDAGADDAVER